MARVAPPVKGNTRTQLLEAGMEVMLAKGYNATGIMEVLQRVGVPKGSFYHYFDSKEQFGLEIINYFDDIYEKTLSDYLDNTKLSPIERLRSYCEGSRKSQEETECRKGCLMGKLGQEMSEQNELFRKRLEEVLYKRRDKFALCIREGQKLGEISTRYDAHDLAEFFLCAWEGAVMRAKTKQNTQSQHVFIKVIFDELLAPNKR
jgi:TetR/AcrR family transcriptional regulator, transcriptional repressor for nem operon